jgi:NAD(P)-dependent dehydrogenase (short-subunit alcohol dehydrogenase family)
MNKKLTLLATGALVASIALAQAGRLELLANMTGSGKGKAKYKAITKGGVFEAQLELEGENLRPNTSYVVGISNGFTANVKTNALGRYAFAQRFAAPSLPFRAGMTVTLSPVGGAVIQTGTFAAK